MLANLTLAVGLLAVSAGPATTVKVYRVARASENTGTVRSKETPVIAKISAPDVHPESSSHFDLEDSSSCCSNRKCKHCKGGGRQKIPHALHAQGDMYPHIPYLAEPKNYYYFRPYQHFHIPPQQDEVQIYGGDRRNPYANEVFRGIYAELEAEDVKPGRAQVEPDLAPPPRSAPVPMPPAAIDPDAPPKPDFKSPVNDDSNSAVRSILNRRAEGSTPPNRLRLVSGEEEYPKRW